MCIRDSGQPLEPLRRIIAYATLGLTPDLTIYLDLDVETGCLLYTSDAADERSSVDLGGRRIIKKKKRQHHKSESV